MAVLEVLGRVPKQAYSFGERNPRLVKGAAVLTGLAAANHLGGELVWENGPNQVILHPYDGPPQKVATLVVPGFGSLGGLSMTQELQQTPFGEQPILYCKYDNKKGAKNEALAKQLVEHQRSLGFECMDVYAPSMGFLHALEIARIARIPLRNVLITGSPSHLRDARAGRLGYAIATKMPYDFRLAGKLLSTFIADSAREGMRKTPRNFLHALQETGRGSSTMLLTEQMKFFGGIDILQNWRDYEGVMVPGYTRIGYAAPLDMSDTTVNTQRGYQGVVQFAGNFQKDSLMVPVTFIQLPDKAGHANTSITLEAAGLWMKQVIQQGKGEQVLFSRQAVA